MIDRVFFVPRKNLEVFVNFVWTKVNDLEVGRSGDANRLGFRAVGEGENTF